MAYGVYSDRGYREHILERNKNTNKTEVFTQEDQTFTGRKTFLSGVTTSDLEVQTVEVSESLRVKGKYITEIIDYLPNDVSKENKLTTKDFVNSSIATNTANFLGTFNTLEEIEALTDVTNNDYAFWKTTDTLGSVVFKRYKYIADEQLWKFEYDLNNSSFTAAQWDAINSGITEELVAKIGDGSALPIGAPMAWLSEVPPVGFLAFDGSEYYQEDFPELYEVVKNIPSFHSDTEGKFKIPNLKGRVLQGADTVIGELIEAGLPNIKGEIKTNDNYGSIQGYYPSGNGAYKIKTKGNAAWQGSVVGTFDLEFDASKGETKTDGTIKGTDEPHVYGNSETVQPPAFTIRWVIKAKNYVSLEKNAIDDTKTTKANAWSAVKTEINQRTNYSTEETVIGKWIDNKPIYRKVFIFETPIQAQGKWGIVKDLENEDTLISGTWLNITPVSGYTMTGSANVGKMPNNKIGIYIPVFSEGNYIKAVILEYTKTTD